MSDYDLSKMEELMAREPISVSCTDCDWEGYEHRLVNNKCPRCNSYAIEYDIPDNLNEEK